jgi:simple sugar transport system ATP-binding protein
MIHLEGIRKYFPTNGVEALSGVDFDLAPGEIHALVGENGAGKSTLMHVLSGQLEPSGGKIVIDGVPQRFHSPRDALKLGIGMVRQHPRFVGGFSFWEDCILGAEGKNRVLLSPREERRRVQRLAERWGFSVDVDRPTEKMTISARQIGAILSLLLRGVRYILLDEPTAVLNPGETERLFDLLRSLRSEGHGIVLISHKLQETLSVADRLTVLRHGSSVGTLPASQCEVETLGSLMFGPSPNPPGGVGPAFSLEDQGLGVPVPLSPVAEPARKTVLRVRDLQVHVEGRPFIRSVDLEVPQGRIVGVAGIRDSGLETLELAIAGLLPFQGGTVEVNDQPLTPGNPYGFRKLGGVYVSADRLGTAMAPRLSLWDSIVVHAHRRALRGVGGRFGLLDRGYLDQWVSMILEHAEISAVPQQTAESLSGGMAQRIILAREFAERGRLMVMAEPGWGLDTAGRRLLVQRLRTYVNSGGSVLLFSTDVDELITVAHEVFVLRDGRVAGRYSMGFDGASEERNRSLIGAAMIGSDQVGAYCDEPSEN